MKRIFLACCLLTPVLSQAQAIVNSWIMNANGKKASFWSPGGGMPPSYTFTNTTDSADALSVCYNADTVWVYSHNMTDNMGRWLNPGNAVAQNYVHRFPRNPAVPANKVISPKIGEIGLLVNGIVIYGLGDANSWTGSTNATPQAGGLGVWNREVGLGEGVSLDTAFGAHPQQQGVYHTHTAPYRLYKNVPTTQHSPIIGWAFDGYPVYGPYGYSSPMNSGGGVSRMKSGYSLRNITTRTTYPLIPGGGAATPQTGPPVSTSYPIGTYCEDYEWLASNGGDLDEYNGRTCVTPEFPGGTYAYFVTIDAAGKAAFPYYIGIYYHGQPDVKNFPAGPNGNGLSIPGSLSCRNITTNVGNSPTVAVRLLILPNPSNGAVTIIGNGHPYTKVTVVNIFGQKVYGATIDGRVNHIINLPLPGTYLVRCDEANGGTAFVQRIVRE